MSRRDFLKGTAAGALGIAASSLLSPVTAFAEDKSAAAEEVSVPRRPAGDLLYFVGARKEFP